LWTWLWGRYNVPQNVFLVNIYYFKKDKMHVSNKLTVSTDAEALCELTQKMLHSSRSHYSQ